MTSLELATLRFWNAAVFSRRAPDRNQENADRVLMSLATCDFDKIRDRVNSIASGDKPK